MSVTISTESLLAVIHNALRPEDSAPRLGKDKLGRPFKAVLFSSVYRTGEEMEKACKDKVFTTAHNFDGEMFQITVCPETMRIIEEHQKQEAVEIGMKTDETGQRVICIFISRAGSAGHMNEKYKTLKKRCADCGAQNATVPCGGCGKIFFCGEACSLSHAAKHTREMCASFKRNTLL